jgi:hypothetical protein
VYSEDPKVSFPLVELSFQRKDLVEAIRAKHTTPAAVSDCIKRFAEAVTAALKEE